MLASYTSSKTLPLIFIESIMAKRLDEVIAPFRVIPPAGRKHIRTHSYMYVWMNEGIAPDPRRHGEPCAHLHGYLNSSKASLRQLL